MLSYKPKTKWEITSAAMASELIDRLLGVGWEPFAVSPETDERYGVIWFRREKAQEDTDGS